MYRIYEHRWTYAMKISKIENPMEGSSSRITEENKMFVDVRKAKIWVGQENTKFAETMKAAALG